MKEEYLNTQTSSDKALQTSIAKEVDKIFDVDQDLKIKMATEYDMLSYVGSDIDEIKMDHLTFFKLFHQVQSMENKQNMIKYLETDSVLKCVMNPMVQPLDNLFTGFNLPVM